MVCKEFRLTDAINTPTATSPDHNNLFANIALRAPKASENNERSSGETTGVNSKELAENNNV